MKKMLVTTDFSDHSKAGMRFAIQLAAQKDVELVFFHCFQALIPTTIHREYIENAIGDQIEVNLQKLKKFVGNLYKSMKIKPGKYRCAVVEHLNPETAILDYAHKNEFNYICISTRGGSALRKIIGSNASGIVVKSAVPVLVVPHNWRRRPISKLLYASDLENLDKEMQTVNAFAKSAGLKIAMTHFYYPAEIRLDPETLTEMWRKKYPQLDQVYLDKFDLDKGFAVLTDRLIEKVKPSIVVFFTHTNNTWFDKIFNASKSKSFAYITKVPMLVYRKIKN